MSSFLWIDHSEKQRRQILEAIDLFREKDTRDELGISVIRDTFADLLFPGTGSLQTRARYFLFIPWMYGILEDKGITSASIGRAVREFEIKLIDTLALSADTQGTIGIVARSSLQRVPSSIYWNGLKTLRICRFDGSQGDYHRAFERLAANRRKVIRNDDGEAVGLGAAPVWATVPGVPADFPATANHRLTREEAAYLRERVLECRLDSLLAFLVSRPHEPGDAEFAWNHPIVTDANGALQRQLSHARNFSEVMFGASILYNLNLAEIEPVREDIREKCLAMFADWRSMMSTRREAHLLWDRKDFWNLIREAGAAASSPTTWFVDAWTDLALATDVSGLATNRRARDLIVNRERNIKGPLARCDNVRAREVWSGESGLIRIDYRWRNAGVILRDVFVGLGELDA